MIAAMRRTLLSCTAMVRDGLVGVGASAILATTHALATEDVPLTVAGLLDLDRQEIAALTTGGAVLGFSVVCAILLMRNRQRAARTETRLRNELHALQTETDRYRALLFTEPQVLISWATGETRTEISGDTAIMMS